MANFNTYQTRHFYVAKAIDSNVDTNGDIALKTTPYEQNGPVSAMYFSYRNADGLLTRSDLIKPENILSVKKTAAADMATPLTAHKITVDTTAVTLSNLVGQAINLHITLHSVLGYDESNTLAITASVLGTTTNTASAAAFYQAMAKAILLAMPKMPEAPFKVYLATASAATEVTKATVDSYASSATSIILVPEPTKYIRGRLSKEVYGLSVAFSVRGSNTELVAWGTDDASKTAAELVSTISGLSPTVIPGVYALADLEYFALGERGDMYRGYLYPNNYDTKYEIDLSKNYNVLTIEFYWQGGAENVQKSPRMIQVAAEAAQSDDIVTTLYNSVMALTTEGRLAALEA